ncbi:MAG: hypothetical protein SGJ02_04310 [bacterium]|nr:hypothetical protein [bacterium]
MQVDSLKEVPVRVVVENIISSRYSDNERPLSWDHRRAGIDVIKTNDNMTLKLLSDGGQTPPKPGWTILVSKGDSELGYKWTLYSMPRNLKN